MLSRRGFCKLAASAAAGFAIRKQLPEPEPKGLSVRFTKEAFALTGQAPRFSRFDTFFGFPPIDAELAVRIEDELAAEFTSDCELLQGESWELA